MRMSLTEEQANSLSQADRIRLSEILSGMHLAGMDQSDVDNLGFDGWFQWGEDHESEIRAVSVARNILCGVM